MVSMILNKKNFENRVSKILMNFGDQTRAFKAIADYELSETKLRYLKQEDLQGKAWKEPFTLRKGSSNETGTGARTKASGWTYSQAWNYVVASNYQATPPGWRFFDKGKGDKILRNTGMLFKSLSRAYGKNFALVGTNVSYAKAQQEGLGHINARPFLGLNRKSYDNVRKVYLNFMKEVLR